MTDTRFELGFEQDSFLTEYETIITEISRGFLVIGPIKLGVISDWQLQSSRRLIENVTTIVTKRVRVLIRA